MAVKSSRRERKKSPVDEAGQKLIDYGMMFSGHG
jgi:hypothetical protein